MGNTQFGYNSDEMRRRSLHERPLLRKNRKKAMNHKVVKKIRVIVGFPEPLLNDIQDNGQCPNNY